MKHFYNIFFNIKISLIYTLHLKKISRSNKKLYSRPRIYVFLPFFAFTNTFEFKLSKKIFLTPLTNVSKPPTQLVCTKNTKHNLKLIDLILNLFK